MASIDAGRLEAFEPDVHTRFLSERARADLRWHGRISMPRLASTLHEQDAGARMVYRARTPYLEDEPPEILGEFGLPSVWPNLDNVAGVASIVVAPCIVVACLTAFVLDAGWLVGGALFVLAPVVTLSFFIRRPLRVEWQARSRTVRFEMAGPRKRCIDLSVDDVAEVVAEDDGTDGSVNADGEVRRGTSRAWIAIRTHGGALTRISHRVFMADATNIEPMVVRLRAALARVRADAS
jgi:hypothetical protein